MDEKKAETSATSLNCATKNTHNEYVVTVLTKRFWSHFKSKALARHDSEQLNSSETKILQSMGFYAGCQQMTQDSSNKTSET